MVDEPLWRQYFTLRSDVVGPVLAKIWDTPGSGYSERMKHLIEPTFAFEYISPIPNARNVLTLSDSSDVIPGGSARLTYGINNRLLARARTSDGSAGTTVQFLTVGIQQTYYATERSSLNDTQYVSTSFRSRPVDLSDIAAGIKVTPSDAARLNDAARVRRARRRAARRHHRRRPRDSAGGSTTLSYSRYRRTDDAPSPTVR